MVTDPRQTKRHSVLQLHGGGANVLAGLIKCVVIESLTGQRIHDLFQSIIADSGGVIIALALHEHTARDVLGLYMNSIQNLLPDRNFLLSQNIPNTHKHFDTKSLDDTLSAMLGAKTLADYNGNIFIGMHHVQEAAQRIYKISFPNKPPIYSPTLAIDMKLKDLALAASAIPGIMHALDGKYIDPISDQNPAPVLHLLSKNFPEQELDYVQLGNVHSLETIADIQEQNFLRSAAFGAVHRYGSYHRHSAHLRDAREIIAPERVTSLVTLSKEIFSAINNSAEQRTRLSAAVLTDIESHAETYTSLAATLLSNIGHKAALSCGVDETLTAIKTILEPHMVKEKIMYHQVDPNAPPQFPKPEIIQLEDTPLYKAFYGAGYLSGIFNKFIPIQSIVSSCLKILLPNRHTGAHDFAPKETGPS